jgi:hypothetical protein
MKRYELLGWAGRKEGELGRRGGEKRGVRQAREREGAQEERGRVFFFCFYSNLLKSNSFSVLNLKQGGE